MATMGNPRDYLILTNNPLVHRCMEGQGLYTIRLEEDKSFREILVEARDMVYAGQPSVLVEVQNSPQKRNPSLKNRRPRPLPQKAAW